MAFWGTLNMTDDPRQAREGINETMPDFEDSADNPSTTEEAAELDENISEIEDKIEAAWVTYIEQGMRYFQISATVQLAQDYSWDDELDAAFSCSYVHAGQTYTGLPTLAQNHIVASVESILDARHARANGDIALANSLLVQAEAGVYGLERAVEDLETYVDDLLALANVMAARHATEPSAAEWAARRAELAEWVEQMGELLRGLEEEE
ncbi:hypothetical protein LTR62_008785 [Meristemomyces frigidus]|uniref:Uncharacterized protein n=1 Tax=Meristemomyces frigidus TaxID=1508187 RepID=A0AAN7TAM4_9PEZI|nr:hypothetical protein LTR62_008785 [Meristemomyces frigidus]